jgi:hypothetical protein
VATGRGRITTATSAIAAISATQASTPRIPSQPSGAPVAVEVNESGPTVMSNQGRNSRSIA